MKIVCLIKNRPAGIYMVNTINHHHKLSLVVLEKLEQTSKKTLFINKIFKLLFNPNRFIKFIQKKLFGKWRKKSLFFSSIHEHYYGDLWKQLDPSIPVLRVDDINSEIVDERLKEMSPELILDKGTSIVKDHIIRTAKLSLNAHSGLSPYYRGAYCTKWALINWDPYNIGVTIHKLSRVIDGGDILVQKRADIKADDTAYSIDMKLGVLVTQLYIEIIDKLKENHTLVFKKQNLSHGYITNGRQWNEAMEKVIEYIEKNGLLGIMLKKPARRHKLPIIEEF